MSDESAKDIPHASTGGIIIVCAVTLLISVVGVWYGILGAQAGAYDELVLGAVMGAFGLMAFEWARNGMEVPE